MRLTINNASDIETAGGVAEWARLGNREALKGWAALISHYLEHQQSDSFNPTEHGFANHYTDADARHCLQQLQEVFEAIHGGKEPNAAFGYQRKRGRPANVLATPAKVAENQERLAEIKQARDGGSSLDEACAAVAGRYKDNPDRLKRLLKEVK